MSANQAPRTNQPSRYQLPGTDRPFVSRHFSVAAKFEGAKNHVAFCVIENVNAWCVSEARKQGAWTGALSGLQSGVSFQAAAGFSSQTAISSHVGNAHVHS